MTATRFPTIQDVAFAIAHRPPVYADPAGVIFHDGDRIKARLGKQRKVGTIIKALDYGLLIHPDDLPVHCQENVYFKDGWRIELLTEQP